MWDLILSVPDHCLSFYYSRTRAPLMLHTHFQGHRPFGSGEEDFLRFLPYTGVAAILVM